MSEIESWELHSSGAFWIGIEVCIRGYRRVFLLAVEESTGGGGWYYSRLGNDWIGGFPRFQDGLGVTQSHTWERDTEDMESPHYIL